MSYILDALRKSEQDRRRSDANIPIETAGASAVRARVPLSVWLAMSAIVLGMCLVVGYIVWQRQRVSVSMVSAPVTEASHTSAQENAPPPAMTSTLTTARIPAVNTAPNAPTLKSGPVIASATEVPGRDLAQEARVEIARPRFAPAVAPKSISTGGTTITASASHATTSASASADAIKFLRAMPIEFQHSLPELAVNIHIYSPDPAQRILYINNHQYKAGDKIRDGIIVEDIVEDGAILSYRGERFKLPRPR